jgi:NAD(P)-dependent dehydrogenase (short-subunit alcohol dehydrogenase family)
MSGTNNPPAGSIVIVTGGTRGIGRHVVKRLHADGYGILFTHSNSERDAQSLEEEFDVPDQPCRGLRVDVSSSDAPQRIFDTAESLGLVTGLVNNAGITGRLGGLCDLTDSDLDRVIAVNLAAPIRLCREAARRWAGRQHQSTIINISSVAARTGSPNEYVAYAATKAALETFTLGLARELAPSNIYVNAVAPGTIDTTIHARAGEPGRAQRVAERIPLKRPGQPEEVAEAVAWLLSGKTTYITGTVLGVTGGL